VKFCLDTILTRVFHYFNQIERSIRAANKRYIITKM